MAGFCRYILQYGIATWQVSCVMYDAWYAKAGTLDDYNTGTMDNSNKYDTLSDATEHLLKKGYTYNFQISETGKLTDNKTLEFDPDEVILKEVHRFEGISNPADSSILYAVQTRSGEKGIVIDSYGADGSEVTSDFMNKVEQQQNE